MAEITWTLPAHAAEVMALFGFPHGADSNSDLWWRTEDDGSIRLFANCSDFFAWACGDVEEITADDMPLLRECFGALHPLDEAMWLANLFASRKRNKRPAPMMFGDGKYAMPTEVQPLFAVGLSNVIGPEDATP